MQAPVHTLTTPLLTLRPWRAADLEPFAALNADPAVMEFMPARLDRGASDAFVAGATAGLEARGWGLWALTRTDGGEFLGCVGLAEATFPAPFTPCLEVLWRLKRAAWGQGHATEAARECLRFAFERLARSEVFAFTVPANLRSRAVMLRLGMRHDPAGDFEHPRLPAGHPLRSHVLYRLTRSAWSAHGGAPNL